VAIRIVIFGRKKGLTLTLTLILTQALRRAPTRSPKYGISRPNQGNAKFQPFPP